MIKIKLDKRNTNLHTDAGLQLLDKSIDKVGIIESYTISNDGVVISGNARHEKISAKITKEPIVIETDGTEAIIIKRTDIESNTKKFHEASILANTTAHKNFNLDYDVIDEIVEEYDIDVVEVGVEIVDADPEPLQATEDDFDTTPPAEPITVLGDLYEIGEHRLLCGDSTDSELLEKLLQGKKPELLLTDPPYGINADRQHFEGHGWTLREKTEWDKSKPESGVLQYLCQITENQIIWGGNYFTDDLPPTMGWLIWDKGQRGFSLADGEMAWTSFNNALRIKEYARAKANQEEKNHPTQKPQEIMQWCFEYADRHSKIEIKLVLDAYLGSGSTMVASHQLKRKCYGMELDPKYCDVIVKRMIKLDPTLIIKRNGVVTKDFE